MGAFSAANRAGSLPNVNQIGVGAHGQPQQGQQGHHHQQQMGGIEVGGGKGSGSPNQGGTTIDLQSCLNNLEDMKNGVNLLQRSGSMRADSAGRASQRNASPNLRYSFCLF